MGIRDRSARGMDEAGGLAVEVAPPPGYPWDHEPFTVSVALHGGGDEAVMVASIYLELRPEESSGAATDERWEHRHLERVEVPPGEAVMRNLQFPLVRGETGPPGAYLVEAPVHLEDPPRTVSTTATTRTG